MSLSKVLNNGEIDEGESQVLQELHLKEINELANMDRKMESETRNQFQKRLLEEINDLKKEFRKKIPHDLLTFSCLLPGVLSKWISSKISTMNLIISGKARKPSENCKSLLRKTISHQEMVVLTSYLASTLASSKADQQTSFRIDNSQFDASV